MLKKKSNYYIIYIISTKTNPIGEEYKLNRQKKLYTIGDISEICGVPVKTLRYYDEIKLLVPEKRDADTNYRYYTEDQMLTLHNIRKLKNYGFSLDEVHTLVYESDIHTLKESLSIRLKDIHEKIMSLAGFIHEIETSIARIELHDTKLEEPKVEYFQEKELYTPKRTETNFKSDVMPVPLAKFSSWQTQKSALKPKAP